MSSKKSMLIPNNSSLGVFYMHIVLSTLRNRNKCKSLKGKNKNAQGKIRTDEIDMLNCIFVLE